ncbi:MAG TPA: hypothetical protein VM888_03835 [Chitinophagaceae bacterium]|jgi:hypothetical protein|nr:hypothetical protein [Chitinophagaceae bacterium]
MMPHLKNYTLTPFIKGKFFENNPNITFNYTSLTLWQMMELKRFARETLLFSFYDYGYNCTTLKGSGTLKVSRLKNWNKSELSEFELITGQTWANFCSYL